MGLAILKKADLRNDKNFKLERLQIGLEYINYIYSHCCIT